MQHSVSSRYVAPWKNTYLLTIYVSLLNSAELYSLLVENVRGNPLSRTFYTHTHLMGLNQKQNA